jgi:hypothetical protein
MAIYCVVFELHRDPDEYRQFFKHLDMHQQTRVCATCSLLFSLNSADSIRNYLGSFIYSNDTLFVGEIGSHWALNKNFEATEWLRELQSLQEGRYQAAAKDTSSHTLSR